jgi:hypothetical protein
MPTNKIKVNTKPIAEQYSRTGERILEISSPGGGGLMSLQLREREGGPPYLYVELYRLDAQVEVVVSHDGQDARDVQNDDGYTIENDNE